MDYLGKPSVIERTPVKGRYEPQVRAGEEMKEADIEVMLSPVKDWVWLTLEAGKGKETDRLGVFKRSQS